MYTFSLKALPGHNYFPLLTLLSLVPSENDSGCNALPGKARRRTGHFYSFFTSPYRPLILEVERTSTALTWMTSVSRHVAGTKEYTRKSPRQEMKLFMPRCEKESYVKIQHAVHYLWGMNILTYKEKYSYGAPYWVKTDKFLVRL